MFYLERCCALQLKIMNSAIRFPDLNIMRKAKEQVLGSYPPGKAEWPALKAAMIEEINNDTDMSKLGRVPTWIPICMGLALAGIALVSRQRRA